METTKGLKIAHMVNWAPGKSGMYESVQELMYEEIKRGYDAKIVDVVPNNPLRKKLEKNHRTLKDGLVVGIERDTWSSQCDILCWHRFMPEIYFQDPRKNLVMFLHGMPDYVFIQEHEKKDKAFSLIKGSYNGLSNCRAYIGMWRAHDGYWSHLLPGKLVNTQCWINTSKIKMKADANFDPDHIKLVCFDTWRGHKEPYWLINAAKLLMNKYDKGELPFKVTLDIFGQDQTTMPSCWIALCDEYLNKNIFFRGYANPQEIFDNHDISLTQIREETRVVRESLLAGMPLVVGETSAPYTDYKAGFRDVGEYAKEIERCCYDIRDDAKRKSIQGKNRAYAIENFNIEKNSLPIFECFEKIVRETKLREYTPQYWKLANCEVENPLTGKDGDFTEGHGTKTLVCSVNRENSPWKEKDADHYYIDFKDVIEYDEKEDFITKYNLDEKFPDGYFSHIYVDYLDYLPEDFRSKFEKYLNRISCGIISKCSLKEVKKAS